MNAIKEISIVDRCPSDEEVFQLLSRTVSRWFRKKYGKMTEPQRCAIPLIKKGYNVLISSPTGTGKTLAAFLGIIDELLRLAEAGKLEDRVYVVYISPLRALSNDMKKNLEEPLNEIYSLLDKGNVDKIRIAIRTSDTPAYEKQKMTKKPPHILITTPESLATALVAPKFREKLRNVKWIVVDEIHELAATKRGAHLSLTLERLEEHTEGKMQRIGLSATIAPLEEVAKFLVGFNSDGKPRECLIVDARFSKPIEIRVMVPDVDIIHSSAEELNEAIYKLLADLIRSHRTTLIFTNTRSATERVVYKLKKVLKENNIADMDDIEAHHSSLGRNIRLNVEEKLKKGQLKAVVSSTSLELGIDIGYIDLVVLLSSPKSTSRLLQRIGRAGHHIRRVSKGVMIAVDRDDLIESTVLAKTALDRKIDRIRIPRNPLDVLAQQIVAMSLERKWGIDEAYNVIRRSYNFRELSYDDYISVLKYLAGYYYDLEDYRVYAKIWLDEQEGVFGKKRGTRAIYLLNNGTIPDETKVKVYTVEGKYVGDLEEAFVQILSPGDIFVLGGRTYEFLYSNGLRVYVKPAPSMKPTVPSWFSEMLPLAFDSALEVGKFRRIIAEQIRRNRSENEIINYIASNYGLDERAAKYVYTYILEQYIFTNGIVPSDKVLLIEHYIDRDEDTSNIIFHFLFGRRVNDALARAYAYIFSRELATPVRVTVTDNGFMLTLPEIHPLLPVEKIVARLKHYYLREILQEVLQSTELLKRRFRHVAQRALMILQRYKGRERDPHRLQLSAQTLLEVLLKDFKNFPILKETYREILEDYMDVINAEKVLSWIENNKVHIKYYGPTEVPSPFAHNIVAKGYSDIVLMEDRKKLLLELYHRVHTILSEKLQLTTITRRAMDTET